MSFRLRLPDLIDRTGVSDRMIFRLATHSKDAVRNGHHGYSLRRDTLEALCRALGLRLEEVFRAFMDSGSRIVGIQ